MRSRKWSISLGVLLVACAQPPAEETLSAVDAARVVGGTADLEQRLAPGVRDRIRDRQAWSRRILADDSVPAERKAEALAEVALINHAYDLFEPAQAAYSQALDLAPEDFRWHYLRGLTSRRLNDLEAARIDFARAADLNPADVPAWVRLGEVGRDLGETEQARAALSTAVELDPDCAAALLAFGQQARADGELERAVDYLRQVLELQPDASAVRTPLGLTYRDLGREDEAAEQLQQAGERGVRLLDPLLQRVHDLGEGWIAVMREASEAAEAGDLATAEEKLRVAIAMDPLSAAPRISWARILAGRGDLDQAREQVQIARFLSDDELLPRRTLARIAVASQDWQRAEQELRAVTALPTAEVSDWLALGAVLERAGRAEEALTVYRDQRNRHPDDAMIAVGEATQLVRLGRCPEALDIVSAQLARRSNDATLGHAQSRLLSFCGGPDAAPRALALAESLFGAVPTAGHAEAVALAQAASGHFDKAQEWQRRALEAVGDTSPERAYHLAVLQALEQQRLPAQPWSSELRSRIFAGPRGG